MPPPTGPSEATQKLSFEVEFSPEQIAKVAQQAEEIKQVQINAANEQVAKLVELGDKVSADQLKRDEEEIAKFHENLKTKEEKHVEYLNRLQEANERYYQATRNREEFERNQELIEKQREDVESRMADAEGGAGLPPGLSGIGKSVLGGLGVGLGIFSLAGLISSLREAREGLRALRLESLQFAAIAGFGGAEGGPGNIAAAQGVTGFARRIELQNIGLVSRDEAMRLAGILGRGGFEPSEITRAGGLGEQAIELGAVTGTPMEEVARTFAMMRNQLQIPVNDLRNAFLDLKITADDLDVPFKEFMENTVQVAKQIKPFGGDMEDARKLVGEFIKEIQDGTVTLSQIANLALGGFAGAREGPMAFLAQELMVSGPPEVQRLLSGAGGPLGQVEALRRAFRGEIPGIDRQALIQAGTGVVGGMVGRVGGDGTEFEEAALQRRLFQIFGIDLPESVSGMTEILKFLERGMADTVDVQGRRIEVEEQLVEHMIRVRDEAENLADAVGITWRRLREFVVDPVGFGMETAAAMSPAEFQRAEDPMAMGGGMGVGAGAAGFAVPMRRFGRGALEGFLQRAGVAAAGQGLPVGEFIGEVRREGENLVLVNIGGVRVNVEDLRSVMEESSKQMAANVKTWFEDHIRKTAQTR